ncbi:flagellar protein FlgN [Oceanobacillus sp. 143]|uniref:Flagellar protein FlgN n=1 Tax=Oceanobacillus zhaokaii TaxID=2052660 RepID=A0A345PJ40_9BACI|nr:flagellar protein FlgN [Oceanobacillus zhaokaii]AXI10020.1 flagellar protein FlgN [Oceanobacillus zhaokaii]QGS69178.1 flagellar protein FlgN [Oceanobacillus sp. 143]
MSVQTIIQSLERLVSVHVELLAISQDKTEIVKEGSVDKLQALLVKERKQIRLLEQAEIKRQESVEAWAKNRTIAVNQATITTMLETLEDEAEQEALASVTTELTKLITKLKQQEQLNQALLNQSMQFVQLSLDMLNPSINNLNYGNKSKETGSTGRSLFDSQA